MSIPTHISRSPVDLLFEEHLTRALATALQGQTAIVIVPAHAPRQPVLNWLVRHVPPERAHELRVLSDAVHFEGSRGQVRIVPHDHVTYDRKQQRLLDYPAGTPVFIHPEVEEG